MVDTVLQLGAFAFGSFEVPEEIRFGGSQRLSVKELVGGKRVLDAMGRADRPLEWSGIFTGPNAAPRARFLDGLRVGGLPQKLTWGSFSYSVVVRDFEASYQRFYRIPYHIVCEVSADQTQPVTTAPPPAIDDALNDDFSTASGIAGGIGDGTLSSLMDGLDTAISSVSSFATAAQSTINGVLQPLQAVQGRVSLLIGSASNVAGNVSTFGGLLPNNPASILAGKLTNQTVNMVQMTDLFQLRNVCGRMNANLVSINAPQKTVAMAGGNLFQVAQDQYGDATAWTALARANNLTDPFIAGTAILKVPAKPDNAGGVLSA